VILVTHGHRDHTDNVAELAKRTGPPVFGPAGLITTMIDLGWVTPEKGVRFGTGGRVNPLGPHITITQVRAEHSPEVTVTDPTIKKSTTYPGGGRAASSWIRVMPRTRRRALRSSIRRCWDRPRRRSSRSAQGAS
jgi:L-ascorbate metabolism protein UlaG (beta-lactamase superfamily)